MHHSRSYSYDEQLPSQPAYPDITQPPSQSTSSGFPVHSQAGHRSHYQRLHGSSPYYVPPISRTSGQGAPSQYPRGAPFTSGQTQHAAQAGYYQQQPSPHTEYPTSTPGYPQPPLSRDSHSHFIPTPSDLASSYPAYTHPPSSQMYPQQPFHEPSDASRTPVRSASHAPPHQAVPSMRTQQPAASAPSSSSAPITERYRCDRCGKTFSRAHDRKRHYESQHHPVPTVHRCRYCEKEFSRADSLKRHLDNGCDEMHSG